MSKRFFFIYLLAGSLFYWPTWASSLHIMLDAGHGGKDRGAVRGSLKESRLTLGVTEKLREHLLNDPRFKVSMTRRTDRWVTLQQRTELAEQRGADLFISIHVNSSPDSRARGAEFYFQNQLPADEESMFLAAQEHENQELDTRQPLRIKNFLNQSGLEGDAALILQDLIHTQRIRLSSQFAEMLYNGWNGLKKSRNYGVRQAPFHVVSYISVPSVLVEMGYLTHASEKKLLASTDYQSKAAKDLYEGLVKFKELLDKFPRHSLD